VGAYGQWQEPNDWAHRNYCGPGATQVALDARLPASQVPNIDTIGAEEGIDPNNGVTTQAIRDELNRRLNVTFYAVSSAASQGQLQGMIVGDIDSGYSLITAMYTGGMPGWGTRNVKHIVATYGYTTGGQGVNYVETSSPTAGYTGAYFQNATISNFWTYVRYNDSQVW
jgi:hypothetical protein